jgi:hypothetical protein
MKTSELIGPALDWAVAKCEGVQIGQPADRTFESEFALMHGEGDMNYSTDWAQGGPIIEREVIATYLRQTNTRGDQVWNAQAGGWAFSSGLTLTGPTPLIAAMRCYVASKLGDEIDVPKELL